MRNAAARPLGKSIQLSTDIYSLAVWEARIPYKGVGKAILILQTTGKNAFLLLPASGSSQRSLAYNSITQVSAFAFIWPCPLSLCPFLESFATHWPRACKKYAQEIHFSLVLNMHMAEKGRSWFVDLLHSYLIPLALQNSELRFSVSHVDYGPSAHLSITFNHAALNPSSGLYNFLSARLHICENRIPLGPVSEEKRTFKEY